MPEPLYIDQTDETPKVILDKEKQEFEITGKCFPENPVSFFREIRNWWDEYCKDPLDTTDFIINSDYFNSSTLRQITDMLIQLENIVVMGKKVNIIWMHKDVDELTKEKGEELATVIELPFVFKVFS